MGDHPGGYLAGPHRELRTEVSGCQTIAARYLIEILVSTDLFTLFSFSLHTGYTGYTGRLDPLPNICRSRAETLPGGNLFRHKAPTLQSNRWQRGATGDFAPRCFPPSTYR